MLSSCVVLSAADDLSMRSRLQILPQVFLIHSGHYKNMKNRHTKTPVVVGIGEILWDMLPEGKRLGGAPANFAFHSHTLGGRAIILRRSGSG